MKKLFILFLIPLSSLFLLTSTASAQGIQFTTLGDLITSFNNTIVRALGTLFMSAGVVAFLFGVVQYIWGLREGNQDQVSKGNRFMIWGLVALFVMFSVYGIIKFFQQLLPAGSTNSITIPEVNFGRGGSINSQGGQNNQGPLPGAPTLQGYTCNPGQFCIRPTDGSYGTCNNNNTCIVPGTGSTNQGGGTNSQGTQGSSVQGTQNSPGGTGGQPFVPGAYSCSPVGSACTIEGDIAGICTSDNVCLPEK